MQGKQPKQERKENPRDDAGNGKQKADDASVGRSAAADDPAQGDDGDGLDVADHGAADGAGFVDDVELRQVDCAGTEPALRGFRAFPVSNGARGMMG